MKDLFEIAGGIVVGSEHAKAGRNNQDAFYWIVSDLAIVAVVTDGCSDAPHSEVGAKIGARIVAETISKEVGDHNNNVIALLPDPPYPFWHNAYIQILRKLSNVLDDIGREQQTILDYFLFTVVGALITPWATSIFSIGDGFAILNSEYKKIGPFENNAPPYIGYALLGETPTGIKPGWLRFNIHSIADTRSIQSILIGTDGIEDFLNAANKKMPGKEETAGPISQFWEDDRYFKNPDMIRRKLALANRTVTKIDWENRSATKEYGLLSDDTTLIVIRRKK